MHLFFGSIFLLTLATLHLTGQCFEASVRLWEQGRSIFPEPLCALIPLASFIFHLIWAARSSRAHQSLPCPDSHQNIDPCHSCAGRALQIPQKCPSAFLFSCLSGLSHAYGNHPVRLLVVGLIWPDKKSNWFQNFHNNIWWLCFFSSAY